MSTALNVFSIFILQQLYVVSYFLLFYRCGTQTLCNLHKFTSEYLTEAGSWSLEHILAVWTLMFFKAELLTLYCAYESSEGFVKTQTLSVNLG